MISEEQAREIDHDRRRRRSAWPSEALALQLQQVADRHALSLMVLADAGGNVWAASRLGQQAEELAAELRSLELSSPTRDGLRRGQHRRRSVQVKPIQLRTGAARLILAAQGRRSARGLKEAAGGVTRILGALEAGSSS